MAADLNLVPFIDLLSVNITFLLLTAVWTQINSLQLDQEVQDPNQEVQPPPDKPPVPPLIVHIRADGVWTGRSRETGQDFVRRNDLHDWEGVKKFLEGDRSTYPDEEQIVILTDDGVEYEHMIKALDTTRVVGYTKSLLGGGAPQGNINANTPSPKPAGG
jgi:biopolymer transport protein ExbD